MMISRENYFAQAQHLQFEKLGKNYKEGHKFVINATENGGDWDLYYQSDKIRDTIDAYFAALNKALKEQNGKQKPVAKTTKPTTVRKTPAKKSAAKKRTSAKLPDCKPVRKTKAKAPVANSAALVRDLDVELRLMNRFKNLHMKPKSYAQVLGVFNAINRAIEKGQIRKSNNPTKYHKEIQWIQEKLHKALTDAKVYSGTKPNEVRTLEFEPAKIAEFKEVWSSYQVYPSVRYGLRFITMEGKAPEASKVKKLYDEIQRAKTNGKLSKNDPNAHFVGRISDALYDYLYGNSTKVEIQSATLNGLAGVVLGCGCEAEKKKPNALNGHEPAFDIIHEEKPSTGNTYFQPTSRQTNEQPLQPSGDIIPAPKGNRLSYQANNLPLADEDTLAFTGRWRELFGNPIKGFSAMIYGPPKSGKSTLSVDLGGYLARDFGNILYASIEEGARGTITERIKRLSAGHPRMTVTNYLPSDIGKYGFVIVDSVSRGEMDIDAMRHVIRANPKTTFIFIFHVTKSGLPRGTSEFQHEVDVVVEVKDGQASAIGRFGPGETDVRFN